MNCYMWSTPDGGTLIIPVSDTAKTWLLGKVSLTEASNTSPKSSRTAYTWPDSGDVHEAILELIEATCNHPPSLDAECATVLRLVSPID